MRGKELIFVTTESGCLVSTSHKLNQDGYLRIRLRVEAGRGPLVMMHRHAWETVYGTIPEGFEIDHKCRNRACSNVDHLQVLRVCDHKAKTNRERSDDKRIPARDYWMSTRCTGTHLGEKFDVTFSSACSWIRRWKLEGVETIRKE